jgi:flagellar biosynthesis/type III secretory pathway protein FliH
MKKLTLFTVAFTLIVAPASAQDANLSDPGPMPGDLTYQLDRFSEQAQLAVSSAPVIGSDEARASTLANIAEERLSESKVLIEMNRTEAGTQLAQQYRQRMDEAVQLANKSGNEDLVNDLGNKTNKHVKVLQGLQETVPEEAQTGIETALGNAVEFENRIDQAMENINRTEGMPGDVGGDRESPGPGTAGP